MQPAKVPAARASAIDHFARNIRRATAAFARALSAAVQQRSFSTEPNSRPNRTRGARVFPSFAFPTSSTRTKGVQLGQVAEIKSGRVERVIGRDDQLALLSCFLFHSSTRQSNAE
jgi:O-acetyl-ADP-ribose deacetylase (regulator of RNase III)